MGQPQSADLERGHTRAARDDARPGGRAPAPRRPSLTSLPPTEEEGLPHDAHRPPRRTRYRPRPGQQADGGPASRAAPTFVDFSHGDVDAFPPAPGAIEAFGDAYEAGSARAYSRYRGHRDLLDTLAEKTATFTGAPVDPASEIMITPGTQSGLYLALSTLIEPADRVAVVEPDYFANRKIVTYLRGEILPVTLHYEDPSRPAELDLGQLEDAARAGAKVLVFSNPNNPTGAVYTPEQLHAVAALAERHDMQVVVDQLYSRLLYPGRPFTHLRVAEQAAERCVTLLGPSKTESLSGFRIGVAVGPASILDRMEQILAIHSLRTAGYNQAVLKCWFNEPAGWLDRRIADHQAIRDALVSAVRSDGDFRVRTTEAGSYLFVELPRLTMPTSSFCDLLRIEEGITVAPGAEFGPRHASSVRLNFSQDLGRAATAVETMLRLARAHRR